ncbi:MAG: aminoacyl-histidine dipeptidase [Acidobacteria bacterium]|nr:aminoacyl-histidine dipeptidase [Acidobacteriota bacterium]
MINKKPELVWRYFEELSKIPRPSGMEERASQFVADVAQKRNLPYKRDKVGNVVISLPASKGFEKSPIVILQGHLDMVCEKNSGTKHDFTKDPIKLKVQGDLVKAEGTTLGADNGIGVAMALALIDDKEAKHGPLELLFTIDEERGLKGANSLSKDFVKGKMLINLDTEEEGAIYIGCAGGTDTVLTLNVVREKDAKGSPYQIKVTGLRGGHSGSDIHEGRGNANQILVRVLRTLQNKGIDYSIVSIKGGSKRNAIPRESFATVLFEPKMLSEVSKIVRDLNNIIKFELRNVDEGIKIEVEKSKKIDFNPLTEKSKRKALDLLFSIPHGVISYDKEIPDLVETSTNFAIIETEEKKINIITSQRSNITPRMEWAAERLRVLGALAGAKATSSGTYHGWTPNLKSKLLLQAKKTYRKITGKEPVAKAIHAGLECGLFGEKFDNLDMISFGPTIKNAHSPDECVSISSVERTYKFLKELLKDIAKGK